MHTAKQKKDMVMQKVTIHIPKQLLHEAQEVSHESITKTITDGLRIFVAMKAAENLRNMRGKIRFSIDVATLREDR